MCLTQTQPGQEPSQEKRERKGKDKEKNKSLSSEDMQTHIRNAGVEIVWTNAQTSESLIKTKPTNPLLLLRFAQQQLRSVLKTTST